MTWLTQNWQTVTTFAGALYTLLSVINGLVQNPEAKSVLGKIIDGLSFLSRASAPGTVKAPFTMSKAPDKVEQPDGSSLRVLLPILLVPMLALQGCGFGTCMLGKLSANAQPLIEEVTVDLTSADYVALLAQLGTTVGSDLVTCTVQSIVAYEQSKQQKAPAGAKAAAQNLVLTHGQIWLNSKKPFACAERSAS
jgi:hypothetical protein